MNKETKQVLRFYLADLTGKRKRLQTTLDALLKQREPIDAEIARVRAELDEYKDTASKVTADIGGEDG